MNFKLTLKQLKCLLQSVFSELCINKKSCEIERFVVRGPRDVIICVLTVKCSLGTLFWRTQEIFDYNTDEKSH